jgi:peptide/nickel transport system substrate-binding protein
MNSSLFTPRRILIGVALLAVLFLLRECFKTRTAAAAAPDQVNIRYDAAATNLNPYLTVKGSDLYTCARIFSTFGEMDPKTMELIPAIVKEIPVARTVTEGPHSGELAYDFEILPEVVWDNGAPVTGHDVAFTLKLIFHPLVPSKAFLSYFKDLAGIDIDQQNPQKFTLYLKQYYILALASMCQVPIMPAYNYDPSSRLVNLPMADFLDSSKLGAFKTDPNMVAFAEEYQQPKYANDPKSIVGSGPYQLETMNEQGVVLVKKQKYWGDALAEKRPLVAAYPKKLVYKVVMDENVVENMLKLGELDIVASSLSVGKFLEMKAKDSLAAKYNFDILPSFRYSRWMFNLNKPNLQDVRVRKALAHIVDYDHFIKNIQSGLAVRIVSPILPIKRYYAKDLPHYDFNIQKAKDLLAEAGWSDSDQDGIVDRMVNGKKVNLTVEVYVPLINTNKKYAESIAENARLAGIQIQAVDLDLSEISKKSAIGDFESAFLGAHIFPGLSDLSQRFHSKYLAPNGDNRSRYINPKLDVILDSISAEKNDARRDRLYLEAQKILHDDVPEVFLLSPAQTIITSKKFEGVITSNRPCYFEQLFKLKKG